MIYIPVIGRLPGKSVIWELCYLQVVYIIVREKMKNDDCVDTNSREPLQCSELMRDTIFYADFTLFIVDYILYVVWPIITGRAGLPYTDPWPFWAWWNDGECLKVFMWDMCTLMVMLMALVLVRLHGGEGAEPPSNFEMELMNISNFMIWRVEWYIGYLKFLAVLSIVALLIGTIILWYRFAPISSADIRFLLTNIMLVVGYLTAVKIYGV